MFTALCEMHDENNLPYSIAKSMQINTPTMQLKYLSKSEMELIKSTVLDIPKLSIS